MIMDKLHGDLTLSFISVPVKEGLYVSGLKSSVHVMASYVKIQKSDKHNFSCYQVYVFRDSGQT